MNKELTPYERQQQLDRISRERQQRGDLQLRGKLEQTVRTVEEHDARQEVLRVLKQEQDFREQVRQHYIANNGGKGDNGFEEAWPGLRKAIVQQQTLAGFAEDREGDTPAARVMRSYGRK